MLQKYGLAPVKLFVPVELFWLKVGHVEKTLQSLNYYLKLSSPQSLIQLFRLSLLSLSLSQDPARIIRIEELLLPLDVELTFRSRVSASVWVYHQVHDAGLGYIFLELTEGDHEPFIIDSKVNY